MCCASSSITPSSILAKGVHLTVQLNEPQPDFQLILHSNLRAVISLRLRLFDVFIVHIPLQEHRYCCSALAKITNSESLCLPIVMTARCGICWLLSCFASHHLRNFLISLMVASFGIWNNRVQIERRVSLAGGNSLVEFLTDMFMTNKIQVSLFTYSVIITATKELIYKYFVMNIPYKFKLYDSVFKFDICQTDFVSWLYIYDTLFSESITPFR